MITLATISTRYEPTESEEGDPAVGLAIVRASNYENPKLRETYDEALTAYGAAEAMLNAAQEEQRKALRSVKPERVDAASVNLSNAYKVYEFTRKAFLDAEDDLQYFTGIAIEEAQAS